MYHQSVILNSNGERPSLDIIVSTMQLDPELARISHPDVLEIGDDQKSIGIESVKNFISWSNKKPFLDGTKLGIIHNADILTPEAQNGLLKTLEEPLSYTLICLVTKNPESLLPTIRSRTLIIPLGLATRINQNPELVQLARDFLDADFLKRNDIVEELAKAEDRHRVLYFLECLMRELINRAENQDLSLTNSGLAASKLAYVGIKSGTNLKLTLVSLAITIYAS